MAWLWFDEDWANHPKFDLISDAAFRLWTRCTSFAQKNRTDGFIPTASLPSLARSKGWKKLVDELVGAIIKPGGAGLLDPVDGGYMLHDWLEYQPSAEEIAKRREAKSEARREAGRKGGQASGEARRSKSEAKPKQERSKTEAKQSAKSQQNEAPLPLPVASYEATAAAAEANEANRTRDTSVVGGALPTPLGGPDTVGVITVVAFDPTVDDEPFLEDDEPETDEMFCRAEMRRIRMLAVNLDEVNRLAARFVAPGGRDPFAPALRAAPVVHEVVNELRVMLADPTEKPRSVSTVFKYLKNTVLGRLQQHQARDRREGAHV